MIRSKFGPDLLRHLSFNYLGLKAGTLLFLFLFVAPRNVWAGFGDFLIRNDIEVDQEGGRPKAFSRGYEEAYWAHDSQGYPYKLTIKDTLSSYAGVGSSILLEQVGLPNLPLYPILLERGHQGVPFVEDVQLPLFENSPPAQKSEKGDWIQGVLQPIFPNQPYRSFDVKELTGKQLAELVGHLLVNDIIQNPDNNLGNDRAGNIRFDGKHFYTLDTTQSFKLFDSSQKSNVGEIFHHLQSQYPELFTGKDPTKIQNFAKELNLILTRIEKLNQHPLNSALQRYFHAVNIARKRKRTGLPPFDFESHMRSRIQNLRSQVVSFFPSLTELKTPDPGMEDLRSAEFPQLLLPDEGPAPVAKEHSSEELLWSYYFQNYWEQRQAAESQWAKELELPKHEVIPALISLAPSKGAKADFRLEKEFPNYYLQSTHPPEQIQQVLSLAMKSLISRLEIPFENENQLQNRGFFKYLLDSIKNDDPNAQLYISGGVVRSMLGYLYQVVFNQKQKTPQKDAWNILKEFSQNTTPIDHTQVLGVGSDFDVLVSPSGGDQNQNQNLIKILSKKINSARHHLKLVDDRDPVVSTLVPFGDVNLYSDQIQRSITSGGSTLDFLAFNLGKNEFKEPDELPGILKDYIRGEIDYLPGSSDITTIRGIRPLIELLYVRYKKNGEQQLIHEIDELKENSLSYGAMIQFEKATRNARGWGAHNRIFNSEEPLEKEIRELILKIGEVGGKQLLVIPKFTPRLKQIQKNAQKSTKTFPNSLLMKLDQFKKDYTQNGVLFHGTPKCEYILAMIRNGFVRSGDEGGMAVLGPGTYTTKEYNTAFTYSGISGCIIPLTLRKGIVPRILDWGSFKNHPFIQQVVEEAKKLGIHEFIYLAQVYGIDIIVDGHVIVENTGVLKLPKNFGQIIKAQFEVIVSRYFQDNKGKFDRPRFENDLAQYVSLYQLAHAVKIEGVHSPIDLIERAVERMNPAQGIIYRNAIQSNDPETIQALFQSFIYPKGEGLADLSDVSDVGDGSDMSDVGNDANHDKKNNDKNVRRLILSYAFLHPFMSPLPLLKSALQYSNFETVRLLLSQVSSFPYPESVQLIEETLHSSDLRMLRLASFEIPKYKGPNSISLIKKALDHPDEAVHIAGCNALKDYSGEEKLPLLKKLFHDPNPEARKIALSAILEEKDFNISQLLDEFFKAQEPISLEEMDRIYKDSIGSSIDRLGESQERFYACLTHSNPKISALFLKNLSLFPWNRHPQAKPILKKVYELYQSNPARFDLLSQIYQEGRSISEFNTGFRLPFEVLDRSDQIELILLQDRENVGSIINPIAYNQLGISPEKWQHALALLENRVFPPLSVAEHAQKVKDAFTELGLRPETWSRRGFLLGPGRINALDAYEPQYFDQTAAFLAKEVKKKFKTVIFRKPFSVIFKRAVPYKAQLLKSPEFRGLIEYYIEEIEKNYLNEASKRYPSSGSDAAFQNLLDLGDPSHTTQQAVIKYFIKKNINVAPKYRQRDMPSLFQLCDYLKQTSYPDFDIVVKGIDSQIEESIFDASQVPDALRLMDHSVCISDLSRSRSKIIEVVDRWMNIHAGQFSLSWADMADILFNSAHPEQWKEEIEYLKNSLEKHFKMNSLDFESWKKLSVVISRVNGYPDWKMRQMQTLKRGARYFIEQPKTNLVDLAKFLIDLPGQAFFWWEERHIIVKRLLKKLHENSLNYYETVFLGRLLEYDSEDLESQNNYKQLRSKAQEFLKTDKVSAIDWINTSFFSLNSPLAQNWKEEHEKLRLRLREILQTNQASITPHVWTYLTEQLLYSKPANSWKEERKLLRNLIPNLVHEHSLNGKEWYVVFQLLNRDREEINPEYYIKLIGPKYVGVPFQFPTIGASLEWDDLKNFDLNPAYREDFQAFRDQLNELILSNDIQKLNDAEACLVKDSRVEVFRPEAHLWLLNATPWQLKQFVFHNELHRPENAYLLKAAQIDDLTARKKFLDANALHFHPTTEPKFLEQLKSIRKQPFNTKEVCPQ